MTDNKDILALKVGGLLYTPALNETIAEKILSGKIDGLTSISFCLEDSILDEALEAAQNQLVKTMTMLFQNRFSHNLPLIFIRVRNAEHMLEVSEILGKLKEILTGFILPKFDTRNSSDYIKAALQINKNSDKKLYIMPIFESKNIADCVHRKKELNELKNQLSQVKDYVLNVRLGGNDFCNLFGLRRGAAFSIYDIGVIRDIISDIVNIFSDEFVVSGVVWEYFGENLNEDWDKGLKKELELDRLNGIVGKTAIHPCQLPLINESLMVSKKDYSDALSILNWKNNGLGVEKGEDSGRMNEVKCHSKWAWKVKTLGDIYGIKE